MTAPVDDRYRAAYLAALKRSVAEAPPLSAEQRETLRRLFAPAPVRAAVAQRQGGAAA